MGTPEVLKLDSYQRLRVYLLLCTPTKGLSLHLSFLSHQQPHSEVTLEPYA